MMVGLAARGKLSCMICVLLGVSAQVSTAQIFARIAPDVGAVGNASCGFRSCPPKFLTYGYYHEHWRRWPEDATGVLGSELTPFAVPDRSTPTSEVPDSRDEASQVLRKRTPVPATPGDADAPMPGEGATSSSGATDQMQLTPGDGLDTGGAGGQFPLPNDPTLSPQPGPMGTDLPTFPESPDALPELEPSLDPQLQSPPAETEDPLDLESLDFGRIDGSSMPPLSSAAWLPRQLNSATGVARANHLEALPEPVATTRAPTDDGGRRNPLRRKVKAQYASRQTVRTAPAPHSATSVAVPATGRRQQPTDGRVNPLRRR